MDPRPPGCELGPGDKTYLQAVVLDIFVRNSSLRFYVPM